MEELFPDNPLHLLPPDHPVWYAEQRINPDYVVPLWGIDSCCRTSVVYCPQDLGCLWDLAGGSYETYPDVLKERIKAALGIGANVMAYATNRQLRDKLDVPIVLQSEGNARPLNRGALHVAKLQHGGGSDEAPKALLNLLRVAGKQLDLDVSDQRRLLSLTDPALADFPLAFIHGRRKFEWTAAERQGLAEFIKNGGVVFGDAICASAEFAESFRQQVSLAVPGSVWQRVPPGHPMFSRRFGGYDLTTVTIRDPQLRAADDDPLKARLEKTTPVLEGIEIDGHYVALFSPWDISCSLESAAPVMFKGYIREDAAKIGINVLLYAMQD